MDKVLLLGIGGSGMSRLALLMKDFGYEVYGLDLKENDVIKDLKSNNIKVNIGKRFNYLDGTFKLVVYSSAFVENDVNLIKAKNLGIKIERRGETLARISNGFSSVVVSGTHGKTTTTTMVGHIFNKSFRVNVYIGGETEFKNFYKDARFFVIESDESDGTFLYFNPFILIITNIDKDHLNYYNWDFENLEKAFLNLAQKSLYKIVSMDDENACSVAKNIKNNIIYYSLEDVKADMFGYNLRFLENGIRFDLKYRDNTYKDIFLRAFGEHNVLNAMASLIASNISGISIKDGINSIATFNLPKRRMEKKWEKEGILLIDDHADHPTEVTATLSALKKHFPERRIVSVYQPHRYTRVSALKERIAEPFYLSDFIILTDIFGAFEEPIEGISGEKIYDWVKILNPKKEVVFIKDKKDIPGYLIGKLKSGDLLVLLGPGDIGTISGEILDAIEKSKI
jgi:UDP-N-acetylmuramate--alanine ligase